MSILLDLLQGIKKPVQGYVDLQKRGFRQLGDILQKVPETRFEPKVPEVPKVKNPILQGLLKASEAQTKVSTKIVGAVTAMPGEWLRSYGKTASKIGTTKKLDFEDFLNISDFIPGIGLVGIGGGVKAVGGKELLKKVGKEALEETAGKIGKKAIEETAGKVTEKTALERLRHLLTYSDEIKRAYNLSDKDVSKIGWKEGKEILEKLPPQLKQQVEGTARRLSKYETQAPIPVEEFEYLFKKSGMDVKKKVSIIDYLRTPEMVLKKVGLEKEAKVLRTGYDAYQTELRGELSIIKAWRDRVPRADSNRTIFQYLDGTLDAKTLNETELQVANEIKTYLKRWADRLGLPEENRITNYITHIFERTKEGVEFPVDIAKKIQEQTAGSVYDPFLMERKGAPDFVKDTWRALEAYVKRGSRKANLDPALDMLKKASAELDPATEKYIQRYSHRINLRPTELDELFDNLIKQSPIGYKFTERPTAYLSNKWRQMVFRGALGLNVGSAMRNLSQGVNTFAELGMKYTRQGYAETIKHLIRNDFDELIKHNVLLDDIVIDRELHATKRILGKMDDVLFALFDFAEKVNRSSAYFGAKKKALEAGKSIPEAIDFAKGIVRKTQFTFNQIDQPVALASDLAKVFTQFGTFPLKQAEFLAGLAKDKNFAGLLRYISGALVLTASYGKLFGMNLKEFIPFNDLRFTSPAGEAVGALKGLVSSDETKQQEAQKAIGRLLPLMVPGGVQLKKSLQGAISGARGYVASPKGRVKYPVGGSLPALLQLILFGTSAPKEAREYYGKDRKVLGEQQSELFKLLGRPYYEQIMKEREAKK